MPPHTAREESAAFDLSGQGWSPRCSSLDKGHRAQYEGGPKKPQNSLLEGRPLLVQASFAR